MGPAVYSPGRAKQLRALLWASVVVAALFTALAVWVLLVGSTVRYAFFLAIPGLLLMLASARTLKALEERGRAARVGALLTGGLLVFIGLVLASVTLGILPSILGVLILLLAVLPDVGDH